MNKFLRIISTLVVGIGLILLFVYLSFQNSLDKTQVLNQPSYYTLQNYWYLLVGGCGCVAFSILSCFLAWNKKMDEKIEILPNAVAADKTELLGWLTGSSLDTRKKEKSQVHSLPKKGLVNPLASLKDIDDTVAEKHGSESSGKVKCAATNGEGIVHDPFDEGQTIDEHTFIEDAPTVLEGDAENTILSDGTETLVDTTATIIDES